MQCVVSLSNFSLPLNVSESVRADNLSPEDLNDCHRLFHAIQQVNSVPLLSRPVSDGQKAAASVKNLLLQYLRSVISMVPASGASNVAGETSLATSAYAVTAGMSLHDVRAQTGSWLSSQFARLRDPFVFPGAAADLAYAAHAPVATSMDAYFFSFKRGTEKQFLDWADGIYTNAGEASGSGQDQGADKELMVAFFPHAVVKRAALNRSPVAFDIAGQQSQQGVHDCKIRTRTNQGSVVGDSLLVAGEYVRNPLRGVLEQIKERLLPGQSMTEMEVLAAEGGNVAQDVIFGFFTIGAYPIVKYGSAKALNVAGNAVNGDTTCLRREFSGEEMAQLLFDTEIGMTDRGIRTGNVPAQLRKVKTLKPNGAFVQEHLSTGVHTEKYIAVQRNGEEIMIREKSPGNFVTYHPHATHPEKLERPVHFDQNTQRIFFENDIPNGRGYDFDIRDGKKFIKLHGNNYELSYNHKPKINRPEIKIVRGGKTKFMPVYMEKLSRAWHLSELKGRLVFDAKQRKLISNSKIDDGHGYVYRAIDNLNPKSYGHGSIYEVRQPGEFVSVAPSLHAIEMSGALVPVSFKVVPGYGGRYVIDHAGASGKAEFGMQWDGVRWKFEAPTSRHVAKNLKNAVKNGMFDQHVSIEHLSPPDGRGICRDKNGNGFLKIKHGFVRLRHYAGKPDAFYILNGNQRMPLVFENNRFRLKTLGERLVTLSDQGLSGKGAPAAVQAGAARKRGATEMIADAFYTDMGEAEKILAQYHFPSSGMYDEMHFAFHVQDYGTIPPWAENFKRVSGPVRNNVRLQLEIDAQKIELGPSIGEGAYGDVFLDNASDIFVIKKFKSRLSAGESEAGFSDAGSDISSSSVGKYEATLERAEKEAELFKRYYGEDSACVILNEDDIYLRMYKVPGESLKDIASKIFPADAIERYVDMLERMKDIGIVHDDLHLENVLYDAASQTFHPIDFSNEPASFLLKGDAVKEQINQLSNHNWNQVMAKIRSLKVESEAELSILGQTRLTVEERELVAKGKWLDDIVRLRQLSPPMSISEKMMLMRGATIDELIGQRGQ